MILSAFCALSHATSKEVIFHRRGAEVAEVRLAQMSIPTWSYDESFYEEKTRHSYVEIRTDPVKGKGLFARRALSKGDVALTETAMFCTQNRDDFIRNIPICGMCLVSCESARGIVARVTKNKTLAAELPYPAVLPRRGPVRCKLHESGCSMVFCSVRCQERAWETFHFASCRGAMTTDQQEAYDAFVTHNWQQGGVDYSDTHFLALRALSNALTLRRLHRQSLEGSFAHIAQLIKAPLHKFNFSFLLRDDDEFAKYEAPKKERLIWQRFQKFKDCPTDDPYVKAALKDSVTKDAMLAEGEALLRKMLLLTDEESSFYLGLRWSELLGSVLLNGQERTPHSPYHEHMERLSTVVEQELRAFRRKVSNLGYDSSKLQCSTSGQGIYTIGCLFNHSCDPNLQVLYVDENDETLTAVCLRDVAVGEELCISYINEAMPYSDRQQQLFEHYLFNCSCTKCEQEAVAVRPQLEMIVEGDADHVCPILEDTESPPTPSSPAASFSSLPDPTAAVSQVSLPEAAEDITAQRSSS